MFMNYDTLHTETVVTNSLENSEINTGDKHEVRFKSVLNPLQIRGAACLGFENIDL
jgi:hypothetical protein